MRYEVDDIYAGSCETPHMKHCGVPISRFAARPGHMALRARFPRQMRSIELLQEGVLACAEGALGIDCWPNTGIFW